MIQHLMVRIHLSNGMHVSVLLFAQATPDLMRPDEEEQYCFVCREYTYCCREHLVVLMIQTCGTLAVSSQTKRSLTLSK
jgi:hypothetical protein